MAAEHKKTPLEVQKLERFNPTTGFTEEFSSLDAVWMEEIDFLPYLPPPCPPYKEPEEVPGKMKVNLDPLWVESIGMLDEDLKYLLQFDHHKFWCQEVLRSIHKRVFMVFLRMSTHKESANNFISPETFGKIIYENFLFDIPKLMDLCVLYGRSNKPLLTKMIANILKQQPKYIKDWNITVNIILETFTDLSRRILGESEEMELGGAVRLDRPTRLTQSEFSEVVLYLRDFVRTLCSFVTIYPPACYDLEISGCIEKLRHFYESTITKLQENWHLLKDGLPDPIYIKECLRSFKKDITWLVHEILHVCFISPQLPDTSGVKRKGSLDAFISIISDIVGEKCFIKEYKKHFNLAEDVRMIQSAHPEIPETHFEYVLSALMEDETVSPARITASNPKVSSAGSSHKSKQPDKGILKSLISQVKDLLPHLGEGFIQICLREFGNDPETVINRILEGNLPPHLKNLDFSQPIMEEKAAAAPPQATKLDSKPEKALVDQRESVFDNDEFDVFRNPEAVDLSRIHIGKKFDSTSTASLLDDKSHLEETRQRYKVYEVETPWDYMSEDQAGEIQALGGDEEALALAGTKTDVLRNFPFDMLYDDEYDDTYDSHNIGAPDDSTDERFSAVKRLNYKLGNKDARDREEGKKPVSSTPYAIKGNERSNPTRKETHRRGGHTGKGNGKQEREGRTVVDNSRAWRDDSRNGESWRREEERGAGGGKIWREEGRGSREDNLSSKKENKPLHGTIQGDNSRHQEFQTNDFLPPPSESTTGPKGRGGGRGGRGGGGGGGGGASKQTEGRARQLKDRNKSSQANHSRKAMADKKKRGGMF